MGLSGPLIVGVFARQMHSTSEFAMTVLSKCLTKLCDNAVCRVVCDKEVAERRRRRRRGGGMQNGNKNPTHLHTMMWGKKETDDVVRMK